MPPRDPIKQILLFFIKVSHRGVLLTERTQVFFHKSRDGGIPLGGNHAGPSVSFIVDCDSDIFHAFTFSHFYSFTN
jgi:hypothetical protein